MGLARGDILKVIMISKLLFNSEDVQFECQLSIDNALENLSHSVVDPKRAASDVQGLVGSAQRGDVFLYNTTPTKRNSFIPTFYGSFSGDDNHAVLKGEITLNRFVKKFMLLWVSVAAVVFAATLVTLILNPAGSLISLAYVFIMFAGAVALLLYIKNNAGPKNELLKERIHRALKGSVQSAS